MTYQSSSEGGVMLTPTSLCLDALSPGELASMVTIHQLVVIVGWANSYHLLVVCLTGCSDSLLVGPHSAETTIIQWTSVRP